MPTNDERADRGRKILETYALKFGDPYDPNANLIDILTDLMHAEAKHHEIRLHFQASLEMARWHFEAEIEEYRDA